MSFKNAWTARESNPTRLPCKGWMLTQSAVQEPGEAE